MTTGLTSTVKRLALEKGAHVVGVASAERFSEAPAGHRPWDLLPGAKSVIVYGMRFYQTLLDGDKFCSESPFFNANDRYRLQQFVGFDWLYQALNLNMEMIGVQLAFYLSELGYKALPLPSSGAAVGRFPDGKNARYAAFSHRHAAVLAGLGTLGLNNLLLHPKYGPRLRLNSTITTAELIPDPVLKKNVCLKEACSLCLKASTCFGEVRDFEMAGLEIRLASFNGCQNDLCRRGEPHDATLPYTRYCIGVCPVGKEAG